MSDTWQETVDVDYQYDCPSENYLDGPASESITENYNGPARLVALIDKETKLVEVTLREWEAYDGRPDRINCDNVVIDCSVNALVCEVLSDYHNNHLDTSEVHPAESRTMKSISTPDGYEEFTWFYPIHPDELYDSNKTTYEDGEWKLQKNSNQDVLGQGDPANWDEIRRMRNGMLWMTDSTANADDAPADLKSGVIDLRQKLRDLPEALKDIDDIFVPSSFPSTKILEQK